MNSKKADLAWQRLVAAARTSQTQVADATAPYGFATRVAAVAFASPPSLPTELLFERFSWKALLVSALLMILCLASTLPFLSSSNNQDDETALADPVSEVVDIGG